MDKEDASPEWIAAQEKLRGPAKALSVIAAISFVTFLLILLFYTYGMATEKFYYDEYESIGQRIAWAVALLFTNGFTFFAARRMQLLKDYRIAMIGTILAMIPFTGPCLVIGLPFAIRTFRELRDPNIANQFS